MDDGRDGFANATDSSDATSHGSGGIIDASVGANEKREVLGWANRDGEGAGGDALGVLPLLPLLLQLLGVARSRVRFRLGDGGNIVYGPVGSGSVNTTETKRRLRNQA